MRFGIAFQLSLLLAGAVVLAVLAVGGLSLWTLRSGFSDYLRQRDEEQLTRLVSLIEERTAADPDMVWLRDDRRAMQDLMDQVHGRELAPAQNNGPPRPGARRGPPEPGEPAPRPRWRSDEDHRPPPPGYERGRDERRVEGPPPRQRTDDQGRPPPPRDDRDPGARRPPPHPEREGYDRQPAPERRGPPAWSERDAAGGPPPRRQDRDGYERRPPPRRERDGGEGAEGYEGPPPERYAIESGAALVESGGPPPRRPDRDSYERRPPPRPERERDDRPPPPPGNRPPGPREPSSAGTLFERVVIRDAQGRWLAGRLQPAGAPRSVRAVNVGDTQVATVEMLIEAHPTNLDASFLQRQYIGLASGALATILAALLAAWWVARRWSRPLLALQQASRQLAGGERMVALQPAGAREIAELTQDMNAMAQSLLRLEQERRLWIAQISHELRTPLAVLRGELESIEDGARAPTPAVIASLRDEVLQLTRLVNDLHTLSMADMQGLPCDFVPGDAEAMLQRIAQRFDEPARQRGLQLQLPAPAEQALMVCWDFSRIEQLLSNLLTNSLRYTDAPGVIRLQWGTEPGAAGQLTLTIDDSAPAVGPDDLGQLFEPLFRVDKARQRGREHGSGLGLSIVRAIVAAHHGQVRAELSPLGGLRLWVRLPLRADLADAPSPDGAPGATP
jgi:two-component system sensor histidine kinase BaeS